VDILHVLRLLDCLRIIVISLIVNLTLTKSIFIICQLYIARTFDVKILELNVQFKLSKEGELNPKVIKVLKNPRIDDISEIFCMILMFIT